MMQACWPRCAWLGAMLLGGSLLGACAPGARSAAPASAPAVAPATGPAAAPASAPGVAVPAATAGALAAPAGLTRVVIASPGKSLNNAPLDVGIQQGFFARWGIEVERVSMAADTQIAAVIAGEVQITTATGSLIRAYASGVPGKVLMYMVDRPSASLYSRPQFRSVRDLAGAKLGVESTVSDTRIHLEAILQGNGLNPSEQDIRIVGRDRIAALVGGSIDATIFSPPETAVAQKNGYVRLAAAKDYIDIPAAGLGASTAYITDHRDIVKRVIAATVDGLEFVKQQRAETIQYIAQLVDISQDDAAFVYDEMPWAEDGRARPEGMVTSLRWIQETVQIPAAQMPSPTEVVDYSVLQEVWAQR
jgi:NitT/TauT family transport system substrate-binding protein